MTRKDTGTTLKRALLVIDVQNEYFSGRLPVTFPSGSLDNICAAMDAAYNLGIRVIIVQHTAPDPASLTFRKGSATWDLHPLIAGKPRDHLTEKSMPCSFTGTDLGTYLDQNGISTVTIAGYMTQMCCDTTARQAFDRGYTVEFLSDATGTPEVSNSAGTASAEEIHRVTLITLQMRFSSVMTTQEWISRVQKTPIMSE